MATRIGHLSMYPVSLYSRDSRDSLPVLCRVCACGAVWRPWPESSLCHIGYPRGSIGSIGSIGTFSSGPFPHFSMLILNTYYPVPVHSHLLHKCHLSEEEKKCSECSTAKSATILKIDRESCQVSHRKLSSSLVVVMSDHCTIAIIHELIRSHQYYRLQHTIMTRYTMTMYYLYKSCSVPNEDCRSPGIE